MSDYRLSDLLDLTIIHEDGGCTLPAAGMPIDIIDAIDGSIVVGSGRQDIKVVRWTSRSVKEEINYEQPDQHT